MADSDDWELSAEEFDLLEKDAIEKISSQRQSSTSSSFSNPPMIKSSLPPSSHLSSSSGTLSNNKAAKLPTPPDEWTLHTKAEEKGSSTEQQPNLSVKLDLHPSGVIAAKFPYHPILIGAFHKIPKSTWHAKERLWMFPISSLSIAEEVLREIDGANVQVQSLDNLVRRALSAASSSPDLLDLYARMPSFVESKLLPFQREGIRFLLQHGGRALLADEMGLGKTLQAIAFAACLQDHWPVLIITPSSLRLHWASTIQQWLDIHPSDILVVLSQCGGSNKLGFNIVHLNLKESIHLDGLFNILSYDVVPKLQDLLLASEFKVIIADESHFLKNAQAKRTSACLPILQRASYAILLSGTPALSRPIELFKQLEALYPNVYRNVHEYGTRYCKGGLFGLYQGASNQEELHNLMKATVMIRRLKKDVLTELPKKRRQQVFLNLKEKDMKQVKILFRELEVIKNNIETCGTSKSDESLQLSRKQIINKIYNSSAEAKIPAVLDYLSTLVEAGCKFLIFAHHQPMIDSIHQYLQKMKVGCIRIDGNTASSARQELVNKFQEKEDIRAAVLSIKAGGVGLTLTAASTVIFAELSWNPGDIIQAEDRAHRIGQASAVNVYYLLANDTVDDIMWDVIQNKLENLGQVLDGRDSSLEVCSGEPMSDSSKQPTLDSFLKRCHRVTEEQPKAKEQRKEICKENCSADL